MMLSLNEFSAGEMHTAKPISLIRPLAEHDEEVLVAGSSDKPIAVILSGEYAYRHFETAGTENWTGLIISNLGVEVDDTSAFNLNFERSAFGAVVRMGTELTICVSSKIRNGLSHITLANELPSLGNYKVGFKRWQLVLGERRQKRIIRVFDLSQPSTL